MASPTCKAGGRFDCLELHAAAGERVLAEALGPAATGACPLPEDALVARALRIDGDREAR